MYVLVKEHIYIIDFYLCGLCNTIISILFNEMAGSYAIHQLYITYTQSESSII